MLAGVQMTLELWNDFPEYPEDATNWKDSPPTVIERYYTKYFSPSRGISNDPLPPAFQSWIKSPSHNDFFSCLNDLFPHVPHYHS